jgi:hypothetical protein
MVAAWDGEDARVGRHRQQWPCRASLLSASITLFTRPLTLASLSAAHSS